MRRLKLQSVLLILGLSFGLSVLISFVFPYKVFGQVGSNMPDDTRLVAQRVTEVTSAFVVEPPDQSLRPTERVARDTFGDVGFAPLNQASQFDRLFYPSVPASARERVVEGSSFFTTPHTAAEGLGPIANQARCAGCHLNSLESVPGVGLVTGISNVTRAGRSTPTNFSFTSGDTKNGGSAAGARLDPVNPDGSLDSSVVSQANPSLDAINNTGRTAAFTIFGDFSPSIEATNPRQSYDPLDGVFINPVTNVAQQFGGFVQHTRPPSEELRALDSTIDCKAEAIPSVEEDGNLGTIDPITGLSPRGFRRGVGERAGPPYIGRGLMEAVPTDDITNAADPSDSRANNSSLKTTLFQCTGDCVTGAVNMIPSNVPSSSDSNGSESLPTTAKAAGIGRFGLRANGVELLQFIVGGLQGELSFTSMASTQELNIANATIAPYNRNCRKPEVTPALEARLSTPFSVRNFLRMTAPPEFGPNLLSVLNAKDPSRSINGNSSVTSVQRGAQLFGIDVTAFANRMIPGRMPRKGDGRDPNAINRADEMVGCVSCHTPVQRTGRSPAYNDPSLGTDVAAVTDILSYRWAPIFSDLILHAGPTIDAERVAPTPRDPILVRRTTAVSYQQPSKERRGGGGKIFNTYDLTRNLTDDIFSNQKATAKGEQFRTPPLMGIGKIGPPFLHDARVYLSVLNRDITPAGTVFSNSEVTNAPLVVRSVDDALRAAIELHDLPAPDDAKTSKLLGGGCPVPPGGTVINKIGNVINYGSSPKDVICPAYDSDLSTTRRSEARESTARFRALSPSDQQAMIDFLKEL